MAYIKYSPIVNKPHSIKSTESPEKQLWQQFVILRHLKRPKGINAKIAIAPFIDQAKLYFLDGFKSDWRSAGLLYYYCFLNLSKALLAAKNTISATKLKSSNIYHGLSAKLQIPKQITDFEIIIHPPRQGKNDNIFAIFYETLMKVKWPYSHQITIKVGEILPFCPEIAIELK